MLSPRKKLRISPSELRESLLKNWKPKAKENEQGQKKKPRRNLIIKPNDEEEDDEGERT